MVAFPRLRGGLVVYTMTYENTAANDAPNGTITTTVPAHTQFDSGASSPGWDCTSVLAGADCTLAVGTIAGNGRTGSRDFAVFVDASVPSGVTEISITATVSYDGSLGADPDPSDKTGTDTTPLIVPPTFTKAFSPDAIELNRTSRVIFTVDNTGSSLAASNLTNTTASLTSSSGDSGTASASLSVNPRIQITPVPSLNLTGLLLLATLLGGLGAARRYG